MEKIKVSMVVGVGKGLGYLKEHPKADAEEVIKYLMKSIDSRGKEKIAAVAAVSRALKFKKENPSATDKQVMQEIMNETDSILSSLEEKEYEPSV